MAHRSYICKLYHSTQLQLVIQEFLFALALLVAHSSANHSAAKCIDIFCFKRIEFTIVFVHFFKVISHNCFYLLFLFASGYFRLTACYYTAVEKIQFALLCYKITQSCQLSVFFAVLCINGQYGKHFASRIAQIAILKFHGVDRLGHKHVKNTISLLLFLVKIVALFQPFFFVQHCQFLPKIEN